MTKADKLRELFPNFISHVDISLDDSCTRNVVFLTVPKNIISISNIFPASCGCCTDCEIDETTLDDAEDGVNSFDDEEFKILINELYES